MNRRTTGQSAAIRATTAFSNTDDHFESSVLHQLLRGWNQNRVATARKNHSIAGQKRALRDPERVSLNEAARLCGVSHRSLERLVEAGLLRREQVAPRAPWQIRRLDLSAEPIQGILKRLRQTGKLVMPGGRTETQSALTFENQSDDYGRHYE